jgi:hypothetical protein
MRATAPGGVGGGKSIKTSISGSKCRNFMLKVDIHGDVTGKTFQQRSFSELRLPLNGKARRVRLRNKSFYWAFDPFPQSGLRF